jgi:hypothetical protein
MIILIISLRYSFFCSIIAHFRCVGDRVIVNIENNIDTPYVAQAAVWITGASDILPVCIMKHAMIPKHDVYVPQDYDLCDWIWKHVYLVHKKPAYNVFRTSTIWLCWWTCIWRCVLIRFALTIVEGNNYYSILNCQTELIKVSSNPLPIHAAAIR